MVRTLAVLFLIFHTLIWGVPIQGAPHSCSMDPAMSCCASEDNEPASANSCETCLSCSSSDGSSSDPVRPVMQPVPGSPTVSAPPASPIALLPVEPVLAGRLVKTGEQDRARTKSPPRPMLSIWLL